MKSSHNLKPLVHRTPLTGVQIHADASLPSKTTDILPNLRHASFCCKHQHDAHAVILFHDMCLHVLRRPLHTVAQYMCEFAVAYAMRGAAGP